MKKIFLLCFIAASAMTNAQSWQWAKSAGGIAEDIGTKICSDANGNIYVTGYFFSATITFGINTLTNADATQNTADIFIAKYDATGNIIWAKRAGGTDDDRGNGICVDNNGNVYVTGYFKSSSITFGTTTLTNASIYADVFITKYDATTGNAIWAKRAGGNYDDESNDINIDAQGNPIITGYFNSSSISFDSFTFSYGTYSGTFVVRYNPSGTAIWAASIGGSLNSSVNKSVCTDANNNIFITGYYWSPTLTFGSSTITNTNSGYYEIFIVKYYASGNVAWAKSGGGANHDEATSISTDKNGNAFITGYFKSATVNFGSSTLNNNSTYNDLFIAKYDSTGTVIWAQKLGGSSDDRGKSICNDTLGNVFVSGYIGSNSVQIGNDIVNCCGSYIVKYDTLGNIIWDISAGDDANSITSNGNNYLFATGDFGGTVNFGTASLTSIAGSDVFVAKLNSPLLGISENISLHNINIFPNPSVNILNIQNNSMQSILFSLYNSLGEKLIEKIFTNETSTINLSAYSNGIYFYRVSNDKHLITSGKIIKQ